LNLNLECYGQTNPEGRARLTRRLIMDLVRIVIFEAQYSMPQNRGEQTCICHCRRRANFSPLVI
jgi:hypothetical protein